VHLHLLLLLLRMLVGYPPLGVGPLVNPQAAAAASKLLP
jgi:hypothetical protein